MAKRPLFDPKVIAELQAEHRYRHMIALRAYPPLASLKQPTPLEQALKRVMEPADA